MKTNNKVALIAIGITITVVLIVATIAIVSLFAGNKTLNNAGNLNNAETTKEQAEPGKKYEKDTKVAIGKETVNIPAGFTLSGATGEYENVDNGIVIYLVKDGEIVKNWDNTKDLGYAQKNYDQFVWIPVPKEDVIAVDMNNDKKVNETDIDLMIAEDRFPMAIQVGTYKDGTSKYRAVLYDFTLSNDGKKVEILAKTFPKTSGEGEPVYLEGGSYADKSSYNNVGLEEDTLQTAFDDMLAKVKNNGGFWVGRYETSNMLNNSEKDTTNKITVVKGTNVGISDKEITTDGTGLNWYRMYAQQKNYIKLTLKEVSTETISSMIWGCQWDQIMIWMRKEPNKEKNSFYVINSLTMGNFGTTDDSDESTIAPAKTGNSDKYKVKNIYDLAGNVSELTLEAGFTDSRARRGGLYESKLEILNRAGSRNYAIPRWSETYDGSRATLY